MMNERMEMAGETEVLVRLHSKLKRIAKARALLDVHEAEALREAQKRQLWRQFGYASLVDYMQRELGYTTRAAEDRLRVANALPDLPKLTEALQTGCLSFSQAKELTRRSAARSSTTTPCSRRCAECSFGRIMPPRTRLTPTWVRTRLTPTWVRTDLSRRMVRPIASPSPSARSASAASSTAAVRWKR